MIALASCGEISENQMQAGVEMLGKLGDIKPIIAFISDNIRDFLMVRGVVKKDRLRSSKGCIRILSILD